MSEPLVERIVLQHVEGPRGGEVDSYCQPTVVIGRAPDCHLVFPTERGVSGHHAVIRLRDGMVELEDTHSTNGTFVNDVRVDRCALKHDDTIRLGSIGPLLRVELPDRAHADLPLAPTPPPANRAPLTPLPAPPPPAMGAPAPPPLPATQHAMPPPVVQKPRATAPQTPLPAAASASARVRSSKSQSSSTAMALIVIGVLIVLGSGALWLLLHRFH